MRPWAVEAEPKPGVLSPSRAVTSLIGDTGAIPGSLLAALYEPLDPSLVPIVGGVPSLPMTEMMAPLNSSTYALPRPLVNHGQSILGISSHSAGVPIIQPEGNLLPLELHGVVTTGALESIVAVQDSAKVEGSNINSGSRGQKRKGDDSDEAVAGPAKKRCSKGTENADMLEASSEIVAGKEVGEGMVKNGEVIQVNERAGKPTLSGRVPLMPTHLAEAGYQGVRAKKVQPTKKPKSKGNASYATKPKSKGYTTKPKSKGNTTKPASKGATKMPAKKKAKEVDSKQATGASL